MEQDVRTRPETFSPKVLLRPIVEDACFRRLLCDRTQRARVSRAASKRVRTFRVPMPLFFLERARRFWTLQAHDSCQTGFSPSKPAGARRVSAHRLLAASLQSRFDEALKRADEAVSRAMSGVIERSRQSTPL